MHSQWVASPMAPTMRKHSCSSSFLTARASIIGVMPSAQWMFFSLKTLIMLMSMKSTAELLPGDAVVLHRSSKIALTNLFTCWTEAGPAAPLIQANEWRMFSFGIHGEWRSTWMPMSPCSNSIGRPSPHSMA